MIIAGLMNIFKKLIFILFGWINLPSLPDALIDSLNSYIDLLFINASVVGFFIRPITLTILLPLVILTINFQKIYDFTMFIIRKLPFTNIE